MFLALCMQASEAPDGFGPEQASGVPYGSGPAQASGEIDAGFEQAMFAMMAATSRAAESGEWHQHRASS